MKLAFWPFERSRPPLAVIASARLPRSPIRFNHRQALFSACEQVLPTAHSPCWFVADFLRRDLLIPGTDFAAAMLALASPTQAHETLDGLWFLHSRGVIAAEHGARIALTRTSAWNGVIEMNQRVFLDVCEP